MGKYTNVYATYEVAPINNVGRIAVHCDAAAAADDPIAQLHIMSWPLGQITQNELLLMILFVLFMGMQWYIKDT